MLRQKDGTVNVAVATALGQRGAEGRAAAISEYLRFFLYGDGKLRASAEQYLNNIGQGARPALIAELVKLLKHADADLRRRAAEALGGIVGVGPPAKQALTAALQDPDPTVQQAAAATLKGIKGREDYRPGWDAR